VDPAGEAGLLRDVLKDDGAGANKAAGGDGALLLVIDGRCAQAAGDATHPALGGLGLLGRGWVLGLPSGLRRGRNGARHEHADD
jgi:hypothetical protein